MNFNSALKWEKMTNGAAVVAFWFVVLTTIGVIAYIFMQGISGISWNFIFEMPVNRGIEGGIWPTIVGTLWLTLGTFAVSVPLGVMSAVYLTEYAEKSFAIRLINLAVVNLAGVPSVVFGLFGLAFFVLFLGFGSSLLSASLTLGIMTLPVVVTATREALVAVPQSYREAAYALGATRSQTIVTHVLPYARPGIVAGTLLGLGRAMGETAPILVTGVAVALPRLPSGFNSRFMALPYHIYIAATQIPGMPKERVWAAALTLLFLVMCLNAAAGLLRERNR